MHKGGFMLYLEFQNYQWSISNGFQFTREAMFPIYKDSVKYVASEGQFEFIKEGDNWFLIPNPKAPNETIINEKVVVGKTSVNNGDVISIGRVAKAKYFCKTTVWVCVKNTFLEVGYQNIGVYPEMMFTNSNFWKDIFGEDCRFISLNQYTLVQNRPEGSWSINALKNVQNQTLLNGKAIQGIHLLQDGDKISVGNESKGIQKCVIIFRCTVQKEKTQTSSQQQSPSIKASNFVKLHRSVLVDSINDLNTNNSTMILKNIDKLVEIRAQTQLEKQLIEQVHNIKELQILDDKSVFSKLYFPVIQQELQQFLHKTANSLQLLLSTFKKQTIDNSPISLWHLETEDDVAKIMPKYHLRMPPIVVGLQTRNIEEHVLTVPILSTVFIDHQNLILTGNIRESVNTFQQILSQIALHLPHQVKFTLIDTLNMGRDFPMRNLLGNRKMVTTDVHQHLEDIYQELQSITSQYLVGDVSFFENLPESLQTDLQYEVIAISNYPSGFNEQQHQLLNAICRNGPLAGKFVIFHWNEEEAQRHQQSNTHTNSLTLSMGDINSLSNTVIVDVTKQIKKEQYIFASLPFVSNTLIMSALQRLESIPKPSTILPFVLLPPEKMWQKSASDFVELDLGTVGLREPLRLLFGQKGAHICTHGAIVGAPGMGKSNFFHALICSMAQEYSPDEVQMYFIDGKSGMTFQSYTDLPHARVVVLKSSQETSADVLDILLNTEIFQRGELFKKASRETGISIASLQDYRKAGYSLPRVFLFIDEYAELFSNTNNQMIVSKNLRMLSKQGRAFGVHFILGGHSFGVDGMSEKDEIFKNIELRIAMKVAEESRMELTTRFGESARQLSERCLSPGQMLYNDCAGVSSATTFARAMFVSSKTCKQVIENVIVKSSKTPWHGVAPFCFSGMDAPIWTENRQIIQLKNSTVQEWSTSSIEQFGANLPEWEPNMLPLWIGKAMTIYQYATIFLKRHRHQNIAIVGEGDAQRFGVVTAMLKSLALFQSKQSSSVVLLNMMSQRTKNIATVVEEILKPRGIPVASYTKTSEISGALETIQLEMQKRQQLTEEEVLNLPSLFCVLLGLDKMNSLEKIPNDYGGDASPDFKTCENLLENGSAVGIHIVISCASFNSFKHMMGGVQDKFGHQLIQNIDRHEQFFADANIRTTLSDINGYPHPMGYWQSNVNSGYVFKPYEADHEEELSYIQAFQSLCLS